MKKSPTHSNQLARACPNIAPSLFFVVKSNRGTLNQNRIVESESNRRPLNQIKIGSQALESESIRIEGP
jgi:hypothetical protein